MDAAALARLVGETAAFVEERFGREPVHVPGADPDGFADLLSLDDVDHLVAGTGLRAPAFRLVRDGDAVPQPDVTRTVRIGSRPVHDLVDVAAVHAAVADGATLVLQGLHRSWEPVTAFCRDLELTLTHPVQANAYLTPPGARGLDLHRDAHDVFAVQTHGRKRWVVHAPGARRWDLELGAGDVLYLPAGTEHAAETLDVPSLHLTIGVRTTAWEELVRRAVDRVLDADPRLRAPLPAAWADDPGSLAADLTERLATVGEALAADVDAADVLAVVADEFWTGRPAALAGGLRDRLEVGDLDDGTLLRRRPGAVFRVTVVGEAAEIAAGDRRLRLPAATAPLLRRLADAAAVRPADLDDLADRPSRLVLCRRLVREGLLTIDRGGHDEVAGG